MVDARMLDPDRPRSPTALVEELQRQILSGELPPGAMLPPSASSPSSIA